MKTIITPLLVVALALAVAGCEQPAEEQSGDQAAAETGAATTEQERPEPEMSEPAAEDAPTVVEIEVQGLNFVGPAEIPSGWTTFKLINEPAMAHFALVQRTPDGRGMKELQEEVASVFQQGMDLLNEGKDEDASEKFGELPGWYGDVVFLGGPGFLAAGRTGSATMYLEPGTYVVECYVKTGGIFHSYNPAEGAYGMVHELTVTEQVSDASEPEPTIRVTISSEDGIEVEDDVAAGEHTIAVHFADQKVYEHFLGHDVQLVRLEQDTDIEALAAWMDWRRPEGLETPAPAEFLGGIQDMPEGATGYFHAALAPGRYAWIAEVPDPEAKNMLKTFTVP